MGSRGNELDGQPTAEGTPEDVAALYSWANLQGAKYRDYSASRREYRAQVRYRAAKALLDRELKAQAEAEAAAAEAERAALAAVAATYRQEGEPEQASGIATLRGAEAAKTRAAAERVEAARRAEAAAHAAVRALREEREIAEAHSSARRQALMYTEAELRRRQLAGPQPRGLFGEPFAAPVGTLGDLRGDAPGNLEQILATGWQAPTQDATASASGLLEPIDAGWEVEREGAPGMEASAPAWLFGAQTAPRTAAPNPVTQAYRADLAGGDTLLDSRERVAARWFALKGVFDRAAPDLPAMQPRRADPGRTPVLVVFSLAGGVGKTSLVATLGRALAAEGEKVLLTDTTSHGLLPVYFGAQEIRRGVVESFAARADKEQPPVSMVVHDLTGRSDSDRQQEMLAEEILRNARGNQRVVVDLLTGDAGLVRRVVDLHPTVLVPMAPDMNSVIGLQTVERLFRGITDSAGRPVLPFYVLNQFDASQALHLDVREVFRRQLGDRLLRFAIRRSHSVSEALAEGKTVLEYAPDAAVSQDYRDVALWLRSVSPPATAELRSVRWGDE
ncbi:MAG TPA: cellulose synthase operon protein YhjQ/BcsQ [Acidobacteriaceae bacterium]